MRQVVDLTTGSISENSVVRRGICIDGNKEDGEVGGHGGRRKKVRRDPNNQIANPNPGSLQSPVRPGRPSVISSSVHSLSPESVRVHVILHNTKHAIGQQVTEYPFNSGRDLKLDSSNERFYGFIHDVYTSNNDKYQILRATQNGSTLRHLGGMPLIASNTNNYL